MAMMAASPAYNPVDDSLRSVLDKVPVVIALLDKNRNVVFGQDRLMELTGYTLSQSTERGAPGDLIGCVNAVAATGGCGTAEECALCGANCAIVRSRDQNGTITQECRIRYNGPRGTGDLDLRVTATPYESSGEQFTLLTVLDASDEKRRRALERLFFHDITNIAGGLAGLAGVLKRASSTDELSEMLNVMERSARSLLDEIEAQRQLATAETGELSVSAGPARSLEIVRDVADTLRYHNVAEGRSIVILPQSEDVELVSDPLLLRRALVNLTKNALEAVPVGEAIELGCSAADDHGVVFEVRNPGVIPAEVQQQLFQRSFSTKGDGRGLGTYSVRLLAERYLHGSVSFVSDEAHQTVFTVRIPRNLNSH